MFRSRHARFLILAVSLTAQMVHAQIGFQLKLDKPKEYEERILRGEKTPDKKIRLPQRILQNTITRYNYFFNASNKLNEVIDRAKASFQDDYTKLLPFYNYSLEKTAADAVQLDSIIWKSNSGLVLHDLRNGWADDLYLLWGASYYFQQKFDSARILFQFINQAFAPRQEDGYTKTIGSARDGNNALKIVTPEKKKGLSSVFAKTPPRRNDAFIWQVRNYIARDQLAEAASLLEALQRDPSFPARLREELHESQAWMFYKQQNWDSTAHHLSQCLSLAANPNERARWEYLLGQLYERTGKWTESEKYYSRCIPRTTNPILEIYARLGSIRTNKTGSTEEISDNIKDLKQMAKRDKYTDYRDIIYYMAAQMQWQTGDQNATKELLLSSVQVPTNNPAQRNQAFEQLAHICLDQKLYRQAYNFYDSIQLNDPKLLNADSIRQWKEVLGVIATQLEIIERQDSLLRIVQLPEEERKDFIRKLARELRRKQGLKEDIRPPVGGLSGGLFPAGGEAKGEWYFYNTNSRSRGAAEFQARWGTRPNTDQWRRISALNNARQQPQPNGISQPGTGGSLPAGSEISFETLYATLPLSPEQQLKLHDSLQQAWFLLGKTYTQRMEDCANGVQALEHLCSAYPAFQPMDDVLFLLYYCYEKNNESTKAKAIRSKLEKDFPSSDKTNLIVTGKDPVMEKKEKATSLYQSVYDQFISGQYTSAMALKKKADSLYGRNYWTPQLMYVEAVYHIQQRSDSVALNRLSYIIQNFQRSPLSAKAESLIRVLARRDSIEQELKNYQPAAPNNTLPDTLQTKKSAPTKVSPAPPPPVKVIPTKTDSTVAQQKTPLFSYRPSAPHQVLVILQEVDPVFANEAKNSVFRYNRTHFYNTTFELELVALNEKQQLLLIGPFADATAALSYLKEARQKAPTEIFSWLGANRYRFGLIDAENLNKVRSAKNYEPYETFLQKEHPDLFR
ncbi:MAG: tetratricopeptide repeat protein [Bacteroidota bacterium]